MSEKGRTTETIVTCWSCDAMIVADGVLFICDRCLRDPFFHKHVLSHGIEFDEEINSH